MDDLLASLLVFVLVSLVSIAQAAATLAELALLRREGHDWATPPF